MNKFEEDGWNSCGDEMAKLVSKRALEKIKKGDAVVHVEGGVRKIRGEKTRQVPFL